MDIFEDNGEQIEQEWPRRFPLEGAAADVLALLNEDAWSRLTRAHKSPLFETPIVHFFVRAFLSDPLDEFLNHITTIEAALGLLSDYRGRTRPKIAKGRSVTECMAARVEALLGTKTDGPEYTRLFDIRSAFLHGRKMDAIPGRERVAARRLARKVISQLLTVALALPAPQSRDDHLNELLISGLTNAADPTLDPNAPVRAETRRDGEFQPGARNPVGPMQSVNDRRRRVVRVGPAEPFPHPRQRVRSGREPSDPGGARAVAGGLDRLQRAAERFEERCGGHPACGALPNGCPRCATISPRYGKIRPSVIVRRGQRRGPDE